MTPEEKLQFEQMKREIELLKRVDDVDNLKYLKEKLIGIKVGANDTGVDIVNNFTVSLITGNGSVTTLDFPDGFLKTKLQDGSLVYIPYYSATRF